MSASKANFTQSALQDRETIDSAEIWRQLANPCRQFLDDVGANLQQQIETFEPEILEHARYAISNPGKRLRPLLVGLAGSAEQGYSRSLVKIGTIIEMIHLATLVHDDVLDAAAVRRNRPTLAAGLGNDVTVLLGDCLFAHALRLASSFSTTLVCQSVAQSTKRVCSGEILQTLNRVPILSRNEYLRVIEMKTAELFGLSCDLGARFGTAGVEFAQPLRDFGLALGTAYQIYDDCLDIFSSEKVAGKSIGTDLIQGKHTLPILILLEEAAESEKNGILSQLNRWDPCSTQWLMTLMNRHRILEKCAEVVRAILDGSRSRLDAMERFPSIAALYNLTDFLELKVGEISLKIPHREYSD